MKYENLPESVRNSLGKDFEETVTETLKCPECGSSMIRRIQQEPNQTPSGRWFVECCDTKDCPHWSCGFTV